ncbi:MAG: YihY/virulence factor BrkB family protein [Betaproteobacteria bacterium]|nr:MAG: YihY/virulence factor BrkB family protein [Betaproteobacteria bacterium]
MKGAQSAKIEPQPLLLQAPRANARAPIGAPWRVLKRAAMAWVDDDAASMGAALAFYSAFSLAPLLIIVIAIAGAVFGLDPTREAVIDQFADVLGPVGADAMKRLLQAASFQGSGLIATVIGTVVLLVGATTVLVELQSDLDRIWNAPPRREGGFMGLLRARLWSLALVLGFGFLLMVSIVVAGAVAALAHSWRTTITGARLMHLLDLAISTGVFTVLFAMLFKWLPNVQISWKDLWVGAFVTAILFNVGRLGIGLYLGRSATGSAYAAAGSFVVLLLWLYYSAQIFLFGAELTWAYAHSRTGAYAPHAPVAGEEATSAAQRD